MRDYIEEKGFFRVSFFTEQQSILQAFIGYAQTGKLCALIKRKVVKVKSRIKPHLIAIPLVLACQLSCFGTAYAQPSSFYEAKKNLVKIYQNELKEQTTIYCQAPINWQGKKGIPDLDDVGYTVRKQRTRAERIEWEHVVPAYNIARQGTRACWKAGGA